MIESNIYLEFPSRTHILTAIISPGFFMKDEIDQIVIYSYPRYDCY